jgi:hypothetical protein
LVEKYLDKGPNLVPKGLKERAMVEQAAAVESAIFHPAVEKVIFEVVGKK